MAFKRLADMHRAGEKSVSSAVRNNVGTWGVDDEVLRMMRARGVQFVCVKARETGARWLTTLEAFFDRQKAQTKTVRNGRVIERHLPVDAFRFRSTLKKL